MISETGAGGIYEWDNATVANPVKWTLQFQTGIVSEDTDVALANDNISGVSLWHFFDFKVGGISEENNTHCENMPRMGGPINCSSYVINGRPGGANHKGVVDFWRREKPIYDIVAAKFNAPSDLAGCVPAKLPSVRNRKDASEFPAPGRSAA